MKRFILFLLPAIFFECYMACDPGCEVGKQIDCDCPNDKTGFRYCLDDGSGWGECRCPCWSNLDCAANEYCDLTAAKCRPDICDHVMQCIDKCGGDDGCGTGTDCENDCPAGKTCNGAPAWECVGCQPDCIDRECGLEPVCGELCGTCPGPEICENGRCIDCLPDCTDRECGPDPICNQSCGTCNDGWHCDNRTCEVGAVQPGDPCPNGNADCPPEFPTCLIGGGVTYCSKECSGPTDASCGAINCCHDFGGGFYCWNPHQCPGEGQPGEPCPFIGDVNADAEHCASGFECLGVAPDPYYGTCPGDLDNECTNLKQVWNPSCVGGNCGASFCSEPCIADVCDEGFQPQNVDSLGCMCIPS